MVILVIILINFMQQKYPNSLPTELSNWECLPLALRSLKPYDEIIGRLNCCRNLSKIQAKEPLKQSIQENDAQKIPDDIKGIKLPYFYIESSKFYKF